MGFGGYTTENSAARRSSQKRGVFVVIKRELRRRSATERVIGHMKADGYLGRCHRKRGKDDATYVQPQSPPRPRLVGISIAPHRERSAAEARVPNALKCASLWATWSCSYLYRVQYVVMAIDEACEHIDDKLSICARHRRRDRGGSSMWQYDTIFCKEARELPH